MLWPTCQKFLPSFCLFSKNGFTFLQSPCVDCPIAPRIHLLHVYKLLLRSKALLHSNFIVWQGYFIGNDSFFHHEVHNTCCSALTLATIWSSMLSHSNRAYSMFRYIKCVFICSVPETWNKSAHVSPFWKTSFSPFPHWKASPYKCIWNDRLMILQQN